MKSGVKQGIRFCELQELQSERLVLRKVVRDDADAYYRNLGSSEAVTRGMLWEPHKDISESVASVEKTLRRYGEGRCYRWAVSRKGERELIGIVELLRFDEGDCSCSFAYMLTERLWGMGYGTEILRRVFRFAFEEMGVEVIRADHFEDNPASGRAMQKAGMTCVGREVGKYVKNSVPHDAVQYELKREDFQSIP